MRKITSIIMCLCLLFVGIIPTYGATDTSAVENAVAALEIMTGDENGSLNLTNNVTRAEFAKMLISASSYKGLIQSGSGSSSFKDVKYTHWAADYIKTVVDAKWMVGYVDGTFRPDSSITFEEAASAILKLLGYDSSTLIGSYPNAQISKFNTLKLGVGISPVQGRALTRNETMYIFYNLMGAKNSNGEVYGTTLGYTMNSTGEINYGEILKTNMEGPYVLNGTALASIIPFDISQATIYNNGNLTSSADYQLYDVVYYNAGSKDVWIYSNVVVGTYTSIAPNSISPSSLIVGGNSYELGTSIAKNKVSSIGEFIAGDTVALLLGMSGEVVDIISAAEIDSVYYGVVTNVGLLTYDVNSSNSNADYTLSVACTDGVVRQFSVNSTSYKIGNIVSASYINGDLTIKSVGSDDISGKVSSDGTSLGDYKLSDDVEIIDVSDEGQWTTIYPSRLSGVNLDSDEIHHYALNSDKEISHLILDDVTGDIYDYGIATNVEETKYTFSEDSPRLSGVYEYIINGSSGTLNTSNILYNISEGPSIFYYNENKISGIKNLKEVTIDELSYVYAISDNQKYEIDDNIQVYIESKSDNYNLTQFSAVNIDEYTMTGYYENIYPAGGQIRLIIANKK